MSAPLRRRIATHVEIALRELRRGNLEGARLIWRDVVRRPAPATDLRGRLDAAIAWINRAHDAAGGGGVARSYCVTWNPYFRVSGWLPPYPETTGYIIPTMFDYAAIAHSDDARRRAIAMAEWEIEVQMADGAVQGGVIGMPPTPAVFNTGQVIFGWVRAWRETRDQRFLQAAVRAGQFLVDHQDDDGAWRRGLSQHAKEGPQTYNTRTAWSLVELADATGDPTFRTAATRNIDNALGRQLANGWFAGNCLDDDDAPLTHTIAYVTRGVLETGIALRNDRYVDAAGRTLNALVERQRSNGSLAGRYDRDWQPAVRWSCLTGNVQLAVNWFRLTAATGDTRYRDAARRSLRFVAGLQDLHHANDGIRGGIAGAYPIFGDYGRFEYLNWATKFFADALMADAASTQQRAVAA